jgi:hypothetical protein
MSDVVLCFIVWLYFGDANSLFSLRKEKPFLYITCPFHGGFPFTILHIRSAIIALFTTSIFGSPRPPSSTSNQRHLFWVPEELRYAFLNLFCKHGFMPVIRAIW